MVCVIYKPCYRTTIANTSLQKVNIFFTGKSLGPPDEGHEGQNAAIRHEQEEVQNASSHMGRCTWLHLGLFLKDTSPPREVSLRDCASGLWAVDETTKKEDTTPYRQIYQAGVNKEGVRWIRSRRPFRKGRHCPHRIMLHFKKRRPGADSSTAAVDSNLCVLLRFRNRATASIIIHHITSPAALYVSCFGDYALPGVENVLGSSLRASGARTRPREERLCRK